MTTIMVMMMMMMMMREHVVFVGWVHYASVADFDSVSDFGLKPKSGVQGSGFRSLGVSLGFWVWAKASPLRVHVPK